MTTPEHKKERDVLERSLNTSSIKKQIIEEAAENEAGGDGGDGGKNMQKMGRIIDDAI